MNIAFPVSPRSWRYHNPVAIHVGPGTLARLPALVGNRQAVLLTFAEAPALGLSQRLGELLGSNLLATLSDIQPNPDITAIAALYDRLWRDYPDADCIIALGGGSCIDSAKSMLGGTPSGTFAEWRAHLAQGAPAPTGRRRRLIAIPTTSGTGSEVTPWATIWDRARGRKYSLHQPWTWPEAAIIDPELMRSLPRETTLIGGLDALSHAMESIWNINRNPVSGCLAVQAARAIIRTLPALLQDLENPALRAAMAGAALEAGLAFSNTKTALAHSLSYDITLNHNVPHGIACSFSLPHIMKLALGRDAETDARLLAIFHADDAAQAIDILERYLASLGVSTNPNDYGITAAAWPTMLRDALRGPRGRNFINATPITD
ncbi:iron-containing alcohol dehydrogenase PsrA [Brenneria populi]|uniref:Iron-containing alcohol dehydrogenase PsrA n=1 Tax=Brenneria populi TaxID=1505588 RepID=A0ABU6JSI1_9GAMM|nr:iron-containing alcohol dehydrogenase PsrA [Brenneria populi Li et al. 2015]